MKDVAEMPSNPLQLDAATESMLTGNWGECELDSTLLELARFSLLHFATVARNKVPTSYPDLWVKYAMGLAYHAGINNANAVKADPATGKSGKIATSDPAIVLRVANKSVLIDAKDKAKELRNTDHSTLVTQLIQIAHKSILDSSYILRVLDTGDPIIRGVPLDNLRITGRLTVFTATGGNIIVPTYNGTCIVMCCVETEWVKVEEFMDNDLIADAQFSTTTEKPKVEIGRLT